MTTDRARGNPIAKFLGADAGDGGPFSLLSLRPELCTDDRVIDALQRRLATVDEHIEGQTLEAEEVRLALHAAAAQLLDPRVRRVMVREWGGSDFPAPLSATAPALPPDAALLVALEHDALLTLGMHGGWNPDALRRLAMLAHARGIPSHRLAEAIRAVLTRPKRHVGPAHPMSMAAAQARQPGDRISQVTPRSGPNGVTAPSIQPASTGPARRAGVQSDPAVQLFVDSDDAEEAGRRRVRTIVIVCAATLITLVVAGITVGLVILSTVGQKVPQASTEELRTPSSTVHSSGPPELFPSQPGGVASQPANTDAQLDELDPAQLAREFDACVAGLAVDPAAAATRFEQAIRLLGAKWWALPPDTLVAMNDRVLEFMYRTSSNSELNLRAAVAVTAPCAAVVEGLAVGASDVAPAVWSAAFLTRLGVPRDLPASSAVEIERAISASLLTDARGGGTFEAGLSRAVTALPILLLAAPSDDLGSVWEQWLSCASAAAGGEETLSQRYILGALDAVLADGPEPTSDQSVFALVQTLSAALTWREGDESRRMLLRWLSGESITSGDLHAVTVTLATRSSAPGVDQSMVLPVGADDTARAALRERYARVWGLEAGPGRDEIHAQWGRRVDEIAQRASMGATPVEHLARAVMYARLSQAIEQVWAGDAAAGMSALRDAEAPLQQAALTPSGLPVNVGIYLIETDGSWVSRYVAAGQNIPSRLGLLQEIASRDVTVATEAELVAIEAVRGSPAQVRRAAADILRKNAVYPAVVNALLELAPTVPKTADNAEVIEAVGYGRLPALRNPTWRANVRRILVERLIQLLASSGELGLVDRLSGRLTDAYAARAIASGASAGDAAGAPPHELARLVRTQWQRAAERVVPTGREPFRLADIDRRRSGRAAIAQGQVQQFAVEQLAASECLAFIVAGEQPTRAADVRRILDRLTDARRAATNILQQIEATERAMVDLWRIRIGELSDAS